MTFKSFQANQETKVETESFYFCISGEIKIVANEGGDDTWTRSTYRLLSSLHNIYYVTNV